MAGEGDRVGNIADVIYGTKCSEHRFSLENRLAVSGGGVIGYYDMR
jgi:hypothetical protein